MEALNGPAAPTAPAPAAGGQPRARPRASLPFGDRHGPAPTEGRLTILDGRDALAFALIRPNPDHPGTISVECGSLHVSQAAAAYVLRQVADELDAAAAAEGDEPIPHGPAVDRPDVLEDLTASTRAHSKGVSHNAYPAGLRAAARFARQYATGGRHIAMLTVLAENHPDPPRRHMLLAALASILRDEEPAPDMVTAEAAARIILAEHADELAEQGSPGSPCSWRRPRPAWTVRRFCWSCTPAP